MASPCYMYAHALLSVKSSSAFFCPRSRSRATACVVEGGEYIDGAGGGRDPTQHCTRCVTRVGLDVSPVESTRTRICVRGKGLVWRQQFLAGLRSCLSFLIRRRAASIRKAIGFGTTARRVFIATCCTVQGDGVTSWPGDVRFVRHGRA